MNQPTPMHHKPSHTALGTIMPTALVVALIAVLTGLYVYQNTSKQNEMNAYVDALDSGDATVMQQFIEQYPNAPHEHILSVKAKLNQLGLADDEWQQTIDNASRENMALYAERHPGTHHAAEALAWIDSLDWQQATSHHTAEAYLAYIQAHADGKHASEAQKRYTLLDALKLKAGERQRVTNAMNALLEALASGNEAALRSCMHHSTADTLQRQAISTMSHVAAYIRQMQAQVGADSLSLTVNGEWSIDKMPSNQSTTYRATGSVMMQAKGDTTHTQPKTIIVDATINANGKIVGLLIN